jgi:hypothetical protein
MGDGADDLRDFEEMVDFEYQLHKSGRCVGYPECGFCDGTYNEEDFEDL